MQSTITIVEIPQDLRPVLRTYAASKAGAHCHDLHAQAGPLDAASEWDAFHARRREVEAMFRLVDTLDDPAQVSVPADDIRALADYAAEQEWYEMRTAVEENRPTTEVVEIALRTKALEAFATQCDVYGEHAI